MDYQISGLPALVTGASRGIGRAIAAALAREGAVVGLCARDAGALESAAEEIRAAGGQAHALPFALGDPALVPRLLENTKEALGQDPALVVVCHASFTPMSKIYTLDPAAVREALTTDLEATFALLSAAIPAMMAARFGRVVLVGSASAQVGQGKAPLYTALKAAQEGLCRNLAIDFSRFGVTTNVVALGFTDTERLRSRADEQMRQRLRQATATRKLARPEQVADVVVFLCSRAAGYVTGAVVPVTGGAHLANLW
jgi:3-oxoacyl-[acyl-carrier protein] reductase